MIITVTLFPGKCSNVDVGCKVSSMRVQNDFICEKWIKFEFELVLVTFKSKMRFLDVLLSVSSICPDYELGTSDGFY